MASLKSYKNKTLRPLKFELTPVFPVSACGTVHLLVDAVSISFYFTLLRQGAFVEPFAAFFLYNFFAFAAQAPLGYWADRLGRPVAVAACGCLLVATGACLSNTPLLGLLILGLGNALFHVGGGIVTLSLAQNRATLPGVFVAPGTLGVAAGTAFGAANVHPAPLFVVLLVIAAAAMAILGLSIRPVGQTNSSRQTPLKGSDVFSVAVLLLCVTISLRQIVGGFGMETAKDWLFAATAAVFFGKALGGILADRFGWHGFTITMVLFSAPLLFCSHTFPLIGVIGLLFFSMSMPVTLTALSVLFPGRPGLAFGLASLALCFGAFTALFVSDDRLTVFLLVCFTAYLFHVGMLRYNERYRMITPLSETQDEKSTP